MEPESFPGWSHAKQMPYLCYHSGPTKLFLLGAIHCQWVGTANAVPCSVGSGDLSLLFPSVLGGTTKEKVRPTIFSWKYWMDWGHSGTYLGKGGLTLCPVESFKWVVIGDTTHMSCLQILVVWKQLFMLEMGRKQKQPPLETRAARKIPGEGKRKTSGKNLTLTQT